MSRYNSEYAWGGNGNKDGCPNWQLGEAGKVREVNSGARQVAFRSKTLVKSSLDYGSSPPKKQNETKTALAVPPPGKPSETPEPCFDSDSTATITLVCENWAARRDKDKASREQKKLAEPPVVPPPPPFNCKSQRLNEKKEEKRKNALRLEASHKQQALRAQLDRAELNWGDAHSTFNLPSSRAAPPGLR